MNNLIMPSGSGATMSSREIAELTGKRHDQVLRDIRNMLEQLEIGAHRFEGTYLSDQNKELPCFNLDRIHVECLLTGYSAPLRMIVLKRLRELESSNNLSLPDFNDPAAMAIAWAEQYKSAQLAIATKAEIGNRREATAMNTASQAVKRANKLEIELDQSQEWSTIKRMEIITGLSFNWRLLKSAGADLGIDAKDVFDPNFGTVKAYHADVWREAYALDIKQ